MFREVSPQQKKSAIFWLRNFETYQTNVYATNTLANRTPFSGDFKSIYTQNSNYITA